MSAMNSYQLPYGLGLCRNNKQKMMAKFTVLKGRTQLLSARLSSRYLWQDYGSIGFSYSMPKPVQPVTKKRSCKCHLSLESGQFKLPSLELASSVFTRACSPLLENPTAAKILPAFTVIVFTLWDLEPVVRQCRNLFFRKSDRTWKKSGTYYVTTTYLKPLLLWAGVTLIFRALELLIMPSDFAQAIKLRLLTFLRSLSTMLSVTFCLTSMIQQTQKFFIETTEASEATTMGLQFVGKVVNSAVWVASISLFMELLGFSTKKWITAGGLGTVLLTLSSREIFTNILSSAMIHVTRPFTVNERIQSRIGGYDVSGAVEEVGWWSPTILRGDDREAVHIPTHKLTINVVRNLSQKTHWRIKNHFAISHLDVNKINNIVAHMRKVLAKNPQVEQRRLHRRVFLENVDGENQALMILVSCFVKTSHFEEYLSVKEAILFDLLRVISHHGARLATPIRTVYTDAGMDSEVMVVGTKGFRINNEDQSKSRTPSVSSNEDLQF